VCVCVTVCVCISVCVCVRVCSIRSQLTNKHSPQIHTFSHITLRQIDSTLSIHTLYSQHTHSLKNTHTHTHTNPYKPYLVKTKNLCGLVCVCVCECVCER